MPQISAKSLSRRLQDNPQATVLVVRTRAEYRKGHRPGAYLLPLDEAKRCGEANWTDTARIAPESSVYVICYASTGAEQAAQFVKAVGVEHLILVRGGA